MNEKKAGRRRWKLLLALIPAAAFAAAILPASTLEKTPVCGIPEHTHTEACYEKRLICGIEEGEVHTHTDACWKEEKVLICTKEEGGHVHSAECIEATTELTCEIPESQGHIHDEYCWESGPVLNCPMEFEDGEHEHTAECYTQGEILVCDKEEDPGHTHTEECYTETEKYICGMEEGEEHVHTDECYEVKKTLICPLEEGVPHTHTDACYEKTDNLICGMEEHTHTESCYLSDTPSNPDDVESSTDWENSVSGVTLTGVWATDLLSIAETQLGYAESTTNFVIVDGKRKGYTRYGAWYGDPYGDWCAMFVSFCLNHASIPANEYPQNSLCRSWIDQLAEKGLYQSAYDGSPEVGDTIFFDWNGDGISDHVGIVKKVEEGLITTLEGNSSDRVQYKEYSPNDSRIMGYGKLTLANRRYLGLPDKPQQTEGNYIFTPADPEEVPEFYERHEENGVVFYSFTDFDGKVHYRIYGQVNDGDIGFYPADNTGKLLTPETEGWEEYEAVIDLSAPILPEMDANLMQPMAMMALAAAETKPAGTWQEQRANLSGDIGVTSEGYTDSGCNVQKWGGIRVSFEDIVQLADVSARTTGGTIYLQYANKMGSGVTMSREEYPNFRAPFRIMKDPTLTKKGESLVFIHPHWILEDPDVNENVWAALKFDNLTLKKDAGSFTLYARGNKIVVGENVTTKAPNGFYIYGGSYMNGKTTLRPSYLVVESGTWEGVFGSGWKAGTNYGTNIAVRGNAHVKELHGGSHDGGYLGDGDDTAYILIQGGEVDTLFGGCKTNKEGLYVDGDIVIDIEGGHVGFLQAGNNNYIIKTDKKYADTLNSSIVTGNATVNIKSSGNATKVTGDPWRNTNRLIKGKTTLNVTTNNHFEYMEFFDEVNLDGEGNQILVQSDHPPGKVGWDGIAGYIGHMTVKNGATLYLNEGGVINRTLEADHIQIPKGGITDLKHGWTGEEKEADRAQSTLKIDGNCITKRLPWAIDDDAFIPGLRVNGTVEGYSVLNCDENTKYSNGTDYYYYVVADASETGGKAFKEPEGADYKVCYRYLPNGKIGWYLREHPVMKLENKLVRVGTGNNGEPINEYYMIMHVDMKGFAYEWSSNSDKNRVDFFWDIYEGISANNTSPIRREVSLETLADISNHLDSSKDIYFINPVFDATGSDEGATDESHQYKKLSAFDVVLDKDPVRKPRYYSVGANFHYTDGDTYNDVRLGDTTDAARCVYDFAKEGDLQFEREVKKDSIMTTTPYADGTKTQGADTALLRVFLPYGMNAAGFTISEDDNHFRFTENADIDAEFTSPSAIDANYELADVEIANSEYAVTIGNQDLGEGTAFAGLGSATKYDCTVFSYKKVNITDITPETEEGLKLNLKLSGLTRNSTAVGNGDPETVSPGELRIQTFPLTYKITYNVNVAAGGTGTAPKDEKGYVYNELATVAAPDSGKMFHTSGKAFAGWNTKKDGTGETYMPGTQLEITQDTTLYAMWSSETFAVQKVWNDYNDAIGLRPPSVAVQLEKAEGDPDADGTYSTYKPVGNPVVLNESNNWRASFPVTKGELMKEYRVVEVNTTEHPYVPGYQAKVTIPYAFQVTNTLREAEFFIKKVDKESQKALANAIFRIQRLDSADGTRLTEYYTDVSTGTNGLANFEKLAVGKYELLEAKAPVGYKRVKKTWTIEITDPNTNWTGTQQLNISVKNSNGETINLGDNNTLIIEDEKVTELPPVGGMGRHLVTLFAVGFTVLALYGRVLYCRRKRGRRSR